MRGELLAAVSFEFDTGATLDSAGQRAWLTLLACMLLSFGFIRFSTRMIRAEVSWWPGNVTPGGLHIHHLVFGIGMGLTLDEFALWLYLDDVYWSEEGRSSVDAVIFASIIAGGFVLGFVPLDAGDGDSTAAIVLTVAVNLGLCVLVALKGKVAAAVVGMFIPPVAWVSAIRLARPKSFWARRRYPAGSKKIARAIEREKRVLRRRRHFQDLIGGA